MPNYTDKYKFTKPLQSELYNVDVNNENMDKVDEALDDLDKDKVKKSGDTMTGDLHLDGKNVYANQFATNATDETPIFVLIYGGDDSVTFQANNRDWSSDNWVRLYRDATVFGKPLNVESGGTGVTDIADLRALVLTSKYIESNVNLLKQPNGVYHREGEISKANGWPYDSATAKCDVIIWGNRNGENGYWNVEVVNMYSGERYINTHSWSQWIGWKKITTTDVT